MLPSKFKREKLDNFTVKPYQKISNTFIENAINHSNANAIKVIFYLASLLEKNDINLNIDLTTLIIDTKQMLKYTDITSSEVRRTLKAMQQTSISFINDDLHEELMINLLPYINFNWGKNTVEIKLFNKISSLIIDVKKNYTFIDTRTLMNLKNKHSLRLLPILNMLNQYSSNVGKRKIYNLEDINYIFGTNYKRLQDIQRKILEPVKEELDLNTKLTFAYQMNFDNFGKGRPRATTITIDLIDNSNSLFAQ